MLIVNLTVLKKNFFMLKFKSKKNSHLIKLSNFPDIPAFYWLGIGYHWQPIADRCKFFIQLGQLVIIQIP